MVSAMPKSKTPSSPAVASQAAADAARSQQALQNRRFMALSINKEALCLQANGGALQQNFAAGQPLIYNVPTANNAFLTGFWVQCKLLVNPATAGGATYTQNAAYPLSLIDSVQVQYGGTQHNFRPLVLKYYYQLRGMMMQGLPRQVLAGQVDNYLQAYYSSAPFSLTPNTNNTCNFSFYVPMNLLHPQDVRGILPIQAGETSCQIIVNCAGAPYGPDPILNSVFSSGGSNPSVAVSGTIAVIAEYKDGQSYSQLAALQPNLSGLQTVQFLRDTPLNNLGQQQLFMNKVSFLKKIAYLIAIVVDGNQSNRFALTSNFQIIKAAADSTGNRPFFTVGQNTNLDVREFYNDLSGKFGGLLQQDFDEGVLPFVYAPIFQQADPTLLEGQHYLDCTEASGYTDYHYGVQMATVNTATIAPRIEAHAIILNDPLVI